MRTHSSIFNPSNDNNEKTLQELLARLYDLNPEDSATRELITNGQLKYWLLESTRLRLDLFQTSQLPIEEWSKAEIAAWSKKIRKQARHIKRAHQTEALWPEILAVLSRAVQIHKGYVPRDVQKIAVLRFLSAQVETSGCMAEIATGEGKSTIIAMFVTALNLLYGINCDIATSSTVLAERDADMLREFYAMFGMTVAHNNKSSLISSVYRDNTIVYGAVHSYLFHYMYSFLDPTNGRGGRKHTVLVIDEVDSMTLDNLRSSARIKQDRPMPGIIEWAPLLVWSEMIHLANGLGFSCERLKSDASAKRLVFSGLMNQMRQILPEDELPYAVREKYGIGFLSYPNEAGSSLIDQIYQVYPKYALEAWCDYEENIDYVVSNNRIVPVDNNDTGVVKTGTVWTWLDNFLRIKHGLELENTGIAKCSLSNVAFFRKYGNQLFGMSGTLGGRVFRERFQKIYPGIALCNIPRFRQRKFSVYPALITNRPENKKDICLLRAMEETDLGRAVLLFCDNIREAKDYFDFFVQDDRGPHSLRKKIDSGKVRVRLYTRNDIEDEKNVPADTVIAGDIVITTRIGGRGMDLSLSQQVKAAGGLHVIQQSLSHNERVEKQAEGRAARMGEPGSGEYIIDLPGEFEKLQISESLFWNEMHNVFSGQSSQIFLYDPEMEDVANVSCLSEDELLAREEDALSRLQKKEALAITDTQRIIENHCLLTDPDKAIRILKARRNRVESDRLRYVVPREIKMISLSDLLYEGFLNTIGNRTSINQDYLWMDYFAGIIQARIEATLSRYSPSFEDINEEMIRKLEKDEAEFVYDSYFEANQCDEEDKESVVPDKIKDPFAINRYAHTFLTDETRINRMCAYQLYLTAIRMDPLHSMFSYYYIAMILAQNKQFEAAIHYLECAMRIFNHYKTLLESLVEKVLPVCSNTLIQGPKADIHFCEEMAKHIASLCDTLKVHPEGIILRMNRSGMHHAREGFTVSKAWYRSGFFGKYEAVPFQSETDQFRQSARVP